jgi:hypothetical protein
MSIGFKVKNITHRIAVKFAKAALPRAKKPYRLKSTGTVLGIHELASKAETYNVSVDPLVIETGMTAGMKLIGHLIVEGYSFNFPLFSLKVGIPGEYDGTETRLPDGVFPKALFRASAELRRSLKDDADVVFIGMEDNAGRIGKARDEVTGRENETATVGGLLTVSGFGLRIEADKAHRDEVGLFFEDGGGMSIKAEIVAVNEHKTLKAVVPAGLQAGKRYFLRIVTQSSAKDSRHLLQEPREVLSGFSLSLPG